MMTQPVQLRLALEPSIAETVPTRFGPVDQFALPLFTTKTQPLHCHMNTETPTAPANTGRLTTRKKRALARAILRELKRGRECYTHADTLMDQLRPVAPGP